MHVPTGLEVSLGVVIPMFYPSTAGGEGPVASILGRVLQDAEIDLVELTWVKHENEERRVRTVLETAEVEVAYSGAFPYYALGLDLAALDEPQRLNSVEALFPWMDQAYRLGAGSFLVLSGQDPGPGLREPAKAALADSVRRLCAHAEKLSRTGRQMSVILEYSDREVDKRCLLGPTLEAVEFTDLIRRDHPFFGLVADQSHIRLLGEDPRKVLPKAAGRIANAHIANCVIDPASPLHGDQHPPFGLPGSAIGLPETVDFLAALRDAGYFGAPSVGRPANVSIELKSRPSDEPELVIAAAKRLFRRALTSL